MKVSHHQSTDVHDATSETKFLFISLLILLILVYVCNLFEASQLYVVPRMKKGAQSNGYLAT